MKKEELEKKSKLKTWTVFKPGINKQTGELYEKGYSCYWFSLSSISNSVEKEAKVQDTKNYFWDLEVFRQVIFPNILKLSKMNTWKQFFIFDNLNPNPDNVLLSVTPENIDMLIEDLKKVMKLNRGEEKQQLTPIDKIEKPNFNTFFYKKYQDLLFDIEQDFKKMYPQAQKESILRLGFWTSNLIYKKTEDNTHICKYSPKLKGDMTLANQVYAWIQAQNYPIKIEES